MSGEKAGVITLEVELMKALGRGKRVRFDMSWGNLLVLPISGDMLTVGRFKMKVMQGPASDETLLDRPAVVTGNGAPGVWRCRLDTAEWAHVETLASLLSKHPDLSNVQVLP